MIDPTLPERLRELAHDAESPIGPLTRAALTGAADEIERLAGVKPLHEIGAELAGDAGVPAPMPVGRRFAAHYGHGKPPGSGHSYFRGKPPAPGSFVLLGPVGSVWRVLAVDELAGHPPATHVLELEAVDPHDVPAHARVETVPMPVDELDPDTLHEAEGGES